MAETGDKSISSRSARRPGVERILVGALPPPERGAPTPPPNSPSVGPYHRKRLVRPHRAHIDIAPEVVLELRASKSFTRVVGASLAEPNELAEAIETASAWEAEVRAAQDWLAHAQMQSALAWHGILVRLQRIRAPLLAAQELEPALALELVAFTRLATARGEAAARAAETTRKRRNSADASPAVPNGAPAASPSPEEPAETPVVEASAPARPPSPVASSAASPARGGPKAPRGKRATKHGVGKRRRRG